MEFTDTNTSKTPANTRFTRKKIFFKKNLKKVLTKRQIVDIIMKSILLCASLCGCSSMVESQPSKLIAWVRFPSPAPA